MWYSVLFESLSNRFGKKNSGWISHLSFILAAQTTYPVDTIRRQATLSSERDIIGVNAARSIFNQDGLAGFFAGSELNIARIVISGSIIRLCDYVYDKYAH